MFCSILLFSMSCESSDKEVEEKGEEKKESTIKGYDIMKLQELPIGLWVTPPAGYQNTSEYAKIKASGINFVNGFYHFENSNEKIMQTLDFCKANGLKYFANKGDVEKAVRKHSETQDVALVNSFVDGIKPYANHAAFAGELFLDEPGKPLFKSIATFARAYKNAYPDKIWHVNLFPTYATGGIQTTNYEDYIDSWISTTSPKHVSYDNYPLLTDASIIDDYFYNLDIVRAKTRILEIPYWTFIQTLSIAGTPGVPNKREPSEADIRWQVWTSLAFGSKGIQYFCYWTPGSGSEQFGAALIDLEGKETVRYAYVKKLNEDVNSIGKVLLNCHAEGVIATPDNKFKLYTLKEKFGEVDAVLGNNGVVGCFKSKEGKNKILATTLYPDKDSEIELKLNDKVNEVQIWENKVSKKVQVEGAKLNLKVKAGNAVFIEF